MGHKYSIMHSGLLWPFCYSFQKLLWLEIKGKIIIHCASLWMRKILCRYWRWWRNRHCSWHDEPQIWQKMHDIFLRLLYQQYLHNILPQHFSIMTHACAQCGWKNGSLCEAKMVCGWPRGWCSFSIKNLLLETAQHDDDDDHHLGSWWDYNMARVSRRTATKISWRKLPKTLMLVCWALI